MLFGQKKSKRRILQLYPLALPLPHSVWSWSSAVQVIATPQSCAELPTMFWCQIGHLKELPCLTSVLYTLHEFCRSYKILYSLQSVQICVFWKSPERPSNGCRPSQARKGPLKEDRERNRRGKMTARHRESDSRPAKTCTSWEDDIFVLFKTSLLCCG